MASGGGFSSQCRRIEESAWTLVITEAGATALAGSRMNHEMQVCLVHRTGFASTARSEPNVRFPPIADIGQATHCQVMAGSNQRNF